MISTFSLALALTCYLLICAKKVYDNEINESFSLKNLLKEPDTKISKLFLILIVTKVQGLMYFWLFVLHKWKCLTYPTCPVFTLWFINAHNLLFWSLFIFSFVQNRFFPCQTPSKIRLTLLLSLVFFQRVLPLCKWRLFISCFISSSQICTWLIWMLRAN